MSATPWAGYVRVSFVGGREGDRFRSPRDQADSLRAWAAARREPIEIPDLAATLASQPALGAVDPREVWAQLSVRDRGHLLRGLIEAVIVRAAGRGRTIPAGDRVRIVAAGTGLSYPARRGERPAGVRGLWLDGDDPATLRIEPA